MNKKPPPRYIATVLYPTLTGLGILAWLWLAFGNVARSDDGFAHWRQAEAASTARVNHAPWSALLTRYVTPFDDGVHRFHYSAVTREDHAQLAAYIATLEKVAVTGLADAEQLAYWINLYNAVTVRVILDHYPVESVRDIRFKFWHLGPWKEKLAVVEGRALSLDDIEHNIVRPIFGDNRAHYALNCAAIGCPNLRRRAYTADNLSAMLEAGAREYINHPRGARFDGEALVVSSLYDWYAEDFGADRRQVIAHLAQYAQPALRRRLERADDIDDFYYDWSLNDAGR